MGLKPEFTKQNKQTNQNQKHIALKIIANPNLASRMRDFTFRQCGVAQTLHSSAKYNCYCSVSTLCPTLCNPMNCSIPAFPVLHYFPEFAQTHVHWVSDAIQPSIPLSTPSPLLSILPSIRTEHRSIDKNNVTINILGLMVYKSTSNFLFSLKHWYSNFNS